MELIEQVIEDLTNELRETEGEKFNPALLESKVKAAYYDLKSARRYPKSWSEETIESDMENYYSTLRNIAEYDYNQVGAEGQKQYSADGVSIHYVSRDDLFKGVNAYGAISR